MLNFITLYFAIVLAFIEDLRDRWADRNSRIKVAKIRRVFSREGGLIAGTLSNRYDKVCDHPGRCATGALLAAAGLTDKELVKRASPSGLHLELLQRVYGLAHRESLSLLNANDSETISTVWRECGLATRPAQQVRVCVVNERLGKLAARA